MYRIVPNRATDISNRAQKPKQIEKRNQGDCQCEQ